MIIPSNLSVFERIDRRNNIEAMSNADMIKTKRHCIEYCKVKLC